MFSVLKEFRDFVMRGNVVDLAVGVVAGVTFNGLIKSVVEDLLTPLISNFSGDTSFTKYKFADMNVGIFINNFIAFILTMFAIFFFVVKPMNIALKHLKEDEDPTDRDCPECLSTVPAAATRCAHCTAKIEPVVVLAE